MKMEKRKCEECGKECYGRKCIVCFNKNKIPWNKGKKGLQISWNKGLTKETDKRVKKYSEKLKGNKNFKFRQKTGKYIKCGICGKNIYVHKCLIGKKKVCSKKCNSIYMSKKAKELGYGKWMKGKKNHISKKGIEKLKILSRENDNLKKYIRENGAWNKGIPLTKKHKKKLKEAKENEKERIWNRKGEYFPCSSCYNKLVYLSKAQLRRFRGGIQKPYCKNCSPIHHRGGNDKDYLNAFLNDKMTLKEINKKYHIGREYLKELLIKNGLKEEYRKRWKKRIGENTKKHRKNQIFPNKDSSIEIKIQNFLKKLGITFFTHQYMRINHSYQCDILIPSMNLVIECDGNYWHKYPVGNDIDHIRTKELLEKGFKVLRLWECEIRPMTIKQFKNKLNQLDNF